ncbi:exonuclease V subunit gamma [Providencia rustigianii]|nr:exonuclease V subunit gamma [Providencia rustigianii]
MFQVYHSNQLDLLKELIAHLMENEPLSHPFEQEIVFSAKSRNVSMVAN